MVAVGPRERDTWGPGLAPSAAGSLGKPTFQTGRARRGDRPPPREKQQAYEENWTRVFQVIHSFLIVNHFIKLVPFMNIRIFSKYKE